MRVCLAAMSTAIWGGGRSKRAGAKRKRALQTRGRFLRNAQFFPSQSWQHSGPGRQRVLPEHAPPAPAQLLSLGGSCMYGASVRGAGRIALAAAAAAALVLHFFCQPVRAQPPARARPGPDRGGRRLEWSTTPTFGSSVSMRAHCRQATAGLCAVCLCQCWEGVANAASHLRASGCKATQHLPNAGNLALRTPVR